MTQYITNIFYTISLIFIILEVFQILYRKHIYDKSSSSISPVVFNVYSVVKFIYIIWILVGLFSGLYLYFFLLLFIGSFKYVALFTKNNLFINLYDIINALSSIIVLVFIFRLGAFQL